MPNLFTTRKKIKDGDVTPIPFKETLMMVNEFFISTTHFLNGFASECESKLLAVDARLKRLDVTLNILEAKLGSVKGLDVVGDAPPQQNGSDGSLAPPGQGLAPPGQGLAPPGQGLAPPGGLGPPNGDGLPPPSLLPPGMGPPGQGLAPPGQGLAPPGLAPPGQGLPPPGQGLPPPGQGLPPPGQGLPPPNMAPPGQGLAPPGQGLPPPNMAPPQSNIPSIQDDPRLKKYLTMIRVKVPKPSVQSKMEIEGFDPAILDMNPNDPSPLGPLEQDNESGDGDGDGSDNDSFGSNDDSF